MVNTLIHFVRHIIAFFSKNVFSFYLPFAHKQNTVEFDVNEFIAPRIQKGDTILTRTEGAMSTYGIPGHWKHCAGYIGDRKVVEATSKFGTKISTLEDLIVHTDDYLVLRPKLTPLEKNHAVERWMTFLGRVYDWFFYIDQADGEDLPADDDGESEMFCSEVMIKGYNHARKGFVQLNKIKILSETVYSFTPNDLANSDQFVKVLERVNGKCKTW